MSSPHFRCPPLGAARTRRTFSLPQTHCSGSRGAHAAGLPWPLLRSCYETHTLFRDTNFVLLLELPCYVPGRRNAFSHMSLASMYPRGPSSQTAVANESRLASVPCRIAGAEGSLADRNRLLPTPSGLVPFRLNDNLVGAVGADRDCPSRRDLKSEHWYTFCFRNKQYLD